VPATQPPLILPAPPSLASLLALPVGTILDTTARRYLGWKWQRRPDGSWTKPPFSLDSQGNPRLASTADPTSWLSLEAAWLSWSLRDFDGIGIELLDEPRGLRRIDLDGVRNPTTGEISGPALELVARFDSLTTVSVSGTGLAIWTIGPPLAGRQARYKQNRPDWPRMCDRDPGIELLSFSCYSCLGLMPVEA
jgi:primase-polymerase (primpol)-like protein